MHFLKDGGVRIRRRLDQGWRSMLWRPLDQGRHKPIVGGEGEKRPPKGHLVVYVGGGEMGKVESTPRRCVVPVVYFNHPLFAELLREVEEEFGFGHDGGITIPCSVSQFERVRELIAGDTSGHKCGCRRWDAF